MPGLNQTGPMGKGSMTGRKMGKCCNPESGKDRPENEIVNAKLNVNIKEKGQGLGQGNRQGTGRGNRQGNGQGAGRGMGRQNKNKN